MKPNRWPAVFLVAIAIAGIVFAADNKPVRRKQTAPPAPGPEYTISGTITGLTPKHRARVVATAPGKTSHSGMTHEDGTYTIEAVPAGSYTVQPTRSGYQFTPKSRTANLTKGAVSAVDFQAQVRPKKEK